MVAFLIRRMFGMIIVLLAVSFVTYLIFFKIPGGDPAQRIAGRTATQREHRRHPGRSSGSTTTSSCSGGT